MEPTDPKWCCPGRVADGELLHTIESSPLFNLSIFRLNRSISDFRSRVHTVGDGLWSHSIVTLNRPPTNSIARRTASVCVAALLLMAACTPSAPSSDPQSSPLVAEVEGSIASPITIPLGGQVTFRLKDYYDSGYRLKGPAEVSPVGALIETDRQDTPAGGYHNPEPGSARWIWVTMKAQKAGATQVTFSSFRGDDEPAITAKFLVNVSP